MSNGSKLMILCSIPTVTTDGEIFLTMSITTDSSETILIFSGDLVIFWRGKETESQFQTPSSINSITTDKINFLMLIIIASTPKPLFQAEYRDLGLFH